MTHWSMQYWGLANRRYTLLLPVLTAIILDEPPPPLRMATAIPQRILFYDLINVYITI